MRTFKAEERLGPDCGAFRYVVAGALVLYFPQAQSLIHAAGKEPLAIRRESDALDNTLVPDEGVQFSSRFHVP